MAVTAAGLLLAPLAGCSTSTPEPATAPSLTSATKTQTPTPSTTSPEAEAAMKAEAILRDYYRATPRCLSDPSNTPITCFDEVAIGTELKNRRNALYSAQQMQTGTSGPIEVLSLKRKSVDLTNKVKETPPTVPTVVFTVCTDVRAFNIVDKDGKSIVPPDRKPHVRVDASVYNYKYPDPAQWRVGYVVPDKAASC